jgi:hypothetical protein
MILNSATEEANNSKLSDATLPGLPSGLAVPPEAQIAEEWKSYTPVSLYSKSLVS